MDEMVDNPVAPDKGDASFIEITIDRANDLISVFDNGRGFDDINRGFVLGDHLESGNPMDISLYGQGGTVCCLVEGRATTIKTTYQGRYHEHTQDWDAIIAANRWPAPYSGRGSTPPDWLPSGSLIEIHGLRRRPLQPQQVEAFIRDLSMTYEPALSDGLQIRVKVRMSRDATEPFEIFEIHPMPAPTGVALQEFSGQVTTRSGRVLSFSGEGGFGEDLTISQSQAYIAFGKRVIIKTQAPFQGIQQGLFCRIYLDSAWRPYLSDIKNAGLTSYEDELMAAIAEQMRPYIEIARRQTRSLRLDAVSAQLEDLLVGVMTELQTEVEREREVLPFPDTSTWREEAIDPIHRVRRNRQRRGRIVETEQQQPDRGVRVALRPGLTFVNSGGSDILGRANISGGFVSITFNENHPIMGEILNAGVATAQHHPAFVIALASLLSDPFSAAWDDKADKGEGVKLFPRIVQRLNRATTERGKKLDQSYVRSVFMAEICNATARWIERQTTANVA